MNYQYGKIYKITNCIDNEIYIGSTCSTLSKRWYEHKTDCNRKPSKIYQHMNTLGIDKFSISLVENYPCTNKTELRRREGEMTKEFGTLNELIAGRTRKEWTAEMKRWTVYYENNKEKVLERHKNYYENNKEKLAEQHKVYREKNIDKRAKYKKEYYENNKEIINRKVECEVCNKTVSHGHIQRHKRSTACVSAGNMNACKESQA